MRLVRSVVVRGALVALLLGSVIASVSLESPGAQPARVDVRLVTDEAEAVLAILEKRAAGAPVDDADWRRLFASEGYVRLKRREEAMKRQFEDAEFRSFVLSDALAGRRQALDTTLRAWSRIDTTRAAALALAYLPKEARIRAKIYPVVKPRENSFVFDVDTDPAIFLYLDPAVTAEQFKNTLAHELHHIGYGSSCPTERVAAEIEKLPEPVRDAYTWIGAFGEGFAMLAAAGGPDVHPHAFSKVEDRERWDRDVANFDADLRKVEQFFVDVLDGTSSDEEQQNVAASFFGVQGPWYTVGWRMSVTIEKTFGRAKLIECMRDKRILLPTYNAAAARYNRKARTPLALWSPQLLSRLK
jgi:hypothetical protein